MKDKLNIGLISYRSNPYCGGQGVYIRNLSRELSNLGHNVEVIAGPPDPLLNNGVKLTMLECLDLYNPEALFRTPSIKELMDPINLYEWLSVSTMGYPEPFTFGLRAYRYLRKRKDKFDIIHDNQCLSYGMLAIKKHFPTIATIHHPISIDRQIALDSVRSWWKKLKHRRWYSFIGMQKKVSRKLDKIITVSESSKNDICNDFQTGSDNFEVVPNGIDTDIFYPKNDIEKDPDRIIVTNSADTALKGLYYLLKALKIIEQKRKIKLTVIGTPKKNGGIEKLVKELNIGHLIDFTGRIDDERFVNEYAKASIAVVPSVYEGFGLPVGEAMACGIPVITTDGGALAEVAGDAAVVVPTKSPEKLSEAIIKLLDDKEEMERLGKAGYERVMENFTWKKAAERTVEVYRKVIDDYSRL
ncbi:MAG: glycosyltransferase family 4 protein [Desulfobacterales bacterium]|nr:glycosyltransferase family 4 protein [Desulfobacterales bacterium]MCP4160167.1 glycosyltransferase family 4 protein [Deltaproteobacteria bacterium]